MKNYICNDRQFLRKILFSGYATWVFDINYHIITSNTEYPVESVFRHVTGSAVISSAVNSLAC